MRRVRTQRVTQYKVCSITLSYFAASCCWYIYVMWGSIGDCVTHMMVGRGELEGPEGDGGHADPEWGPHLSMIRK